MRRLHPVTFFALLGALDCLAWVRWTPSARRHGRIIAAPPHRHHPTCWSPFLARTSYTKRHATTLAPSDDNEREEKLDLNIVLIDHYDSFTYNLADLLSQLCRHPPLVLAADCVDTWEELLHSQAYLSRNWTRGVDGVVLSPGPGTPDQAERRLSRDLIEQNPNLPILGVCLGHQIMGHVYGAAVDLAPEPIHGQVCPVRILEDPTVDRLLRNLETSIDVTRYHSLHVTDLHNETGLLATAVSDDDEAIVMGMRHVENPHFGVQFHPESIGTPSGHDILANFCKVCHEHSVASSSLLSPTSLASSVPATTGTTFHNSHNNAAASSPSSAPEAVSSKKQHQVFIHKISRGSTRIRPVDVMKDFISTGDGSDYSFWLDEPQTDAATTAHMMGQQPTTRSDDGTAAAISLLGLGRQRIEYWGKEKPARQRGLYVWRGSNKGDDDDDGSPSEVFHDRDVLTYLQQEHGAPTIEATLVSFDSQNHNMITMERHSEESLHDTLPFSFRGGHVGFLGYEVRHDTERFIQDEERGRNHCQPRRRDAHEHYQQTSDPHVPTAAFIWADRSFVYDHSKQDWYLVAVSSDDGAADDAKNEALNWIRDTAEKLCRWSPAPQFINGDSHQRHGQAKISLYRPTPFRPKRSRTTYKRNFQQCMDHIRQGDSYELCLTNQLETFVQRESAPPPLDLYNVLRRRNPAPFSAFLNWNSEQRVPSGTNAALAICCSSPERFVSVKRVHQRNDHQRHGTAPSNGRVNGHSHTAAVASPFQLLVEAKPIKGTCARVLPPASADSLGALSAMQVAAEDQARADSLRASVKDRAENLMIVDLLRNDLSRVCEPGSVHVAKLMDIESFATVHQMVSTICGTLNPRKASALDVLKASFPGGSMTGAPKLRTMELLDEMEEGVCRGPYSGSLGYISLNGSMDMNILIRTAVLTPTTTTRTRKSRIHGGNEDQWKVTIGAGGAITALSESEDEYEELMLKASAVMQAVQEWSTSATTTNGVSSIRRPFLEELKQTQKPYMATNETAMTVTRS